MTTHDPNITGMGTKCQEIVTVGQSFFTSHLEIWRDFRNNHTWESNCFPSRLLEQIFIL